MLRCNVLGDDLAFAQRMLRRGWIRFARLAIRNEDAVAQGPHAGPVRDFQIFVDRQATPFLFAGQRLQ